MSRLATMLSVTFLGTSSGGGPSMMRNCSSLVADIQGNGKLWMVDCAEGTLRQFSLQPEQEVERVKVSKVEKIFVTHMHADHVMGLITLLRNVLYPVPNPAQGPRPIREEPTIEIYGPAGIRNFVRQNMKMTLSRSSDKYVVHELLTPQDVPTTCDDHERHSSEVIGRDILSDSTGLWRAFLSSSAPLSVDAGPILHRDPCLGYIFRRTDIGRSIAILGDTYDASPILPLFQSPPDLLIHEATDAFIHTNVDGRATRSPEAVAQAALFRGHSTPHQAGAFAQFVGAKQLVLNHIGSRFPLPGPGMGARLRQVRADVISEIERQASEAWGVPGAKAAHDFMRVDIPTGIEEAEPSYDWQNRHRPRNEDDAPNVWNSRQRGRGRGQSHHSRFHRPY